MNSIISYLLLSVPIRYCNEIAEDLKTMPEVTEVAALYGEMDMLIKIETRDNRELDRVLLEIIRKYKHIENSRTYVVVSDIHWTKEG